MEFNPGNQVVKRCLEGMALEGRGNDPEAARVFMQAWNEATNDFEKFLAAYYVARHQQTANDQVQWLKTALACAAKVNDESVRAGMVALHERLAQCYQELNDADNVRVHQKLAAALNTTPADKGPFYHGTRAALKVGELLIPGYMSNYKSDLMMNHIYFTALANGAGLAAALAKGETSERVYIVEPTGVFEDDPNVTNKKFPGNPTRSYRTQEPLKVVGELTEWMRITPEELRKWKEKLAQSDGEIIN